MTDKKLDPDVTAVTPEWIEQQCNAFEATLLGFTQVMRERFREKAAQGRGRWQRQEEAQGLYQAMLTHGAAMPLAAGAEADIGNFAAFLWRLNTENPGLAVRPTTGARAFASGYGLQADLELVGKTLELVKRSMPTEARENAWLCSIDPPAVINILNEEAAA